jgi:hypothetical protein
MSKQKKYEFNQQFATLRLREHINEGRVMFTIDDEDVDQAFMNHFEADVDYIHDGPDVYYVTDQNELERFVDYIESKGLNGDAIQVQQYFKEEGSVTGGEGYLPAMDVPSKKQNPYKENKQEYFIQVDVRDAKNALAIIDDSYSLSNSIKKRGSDVYTTYDVMAAEELVDSLKQNGIRSKNNVEGYVDEDVLSGYTQDKNFRPGHTKDRGGFQYKDLWDLNEDKVIGKTKSGKDIYLDFNNPAHKDFTAADHDDASQVLLTVKSQPGTRSKNTVTPMRKKAAKQHFDASKAKQKGISEAYDKSKIKTNADELARVEAYYKEASASQKSPAEARIKKLKILVGIEKRTGKKLPVLTYGTDWSEYLKKQKVKDSKELEAKLSKSDINENKLSVLKEMNQIVDEVFSPEDYRKVLQVIEKIKYTNTKLYNAILDMISDIYPHSYREVEAQLALKENYNKFKNETKTRTKPEQFHQAVKSVKRKVEEINKLYEYMERLKLELSEGSDSLKYKKYTENAIFKIKEAVKALHIKTKKLK